MSTTLNTSNVAGIDPAAAGAVAQHQAVPHVDPYAAAKELRELAKEGMSLQPGLALVPDASAVRYPLEECRMHLHDAVIYKGRSDEYLDGFDHLLFELEQAIKTRRVSECEPKLAAVRHQVSNVKSRQLRVKQCLAAAVVQGGKAREEVNLLSQASPSETDTPAIKRMREILDRVHILSQSIPTVPNMPLADQASQALRAVAAILRANGFVDSSVPAQDSYAVAEEDPDHEIEVEEEAGDGDPWE